MESNEGGVVEKEECSPSDKIVPETPRSTHEQLDVTKVYKDKETLTSPSLKEKVTFVDSPIIRRNSEPQHDYPIKEPIKGLARIIRSKTGFPKTVFVIL